MSLIFICALLLLVGCLRGKANDGVVDSVKGGGGRSFLEPLFALVQRKVPLSFTPESGGASPKFGKAKFDLKCSLK